MQKICNRRLKSAMALATALALTVSGITVPDAKAASKNEPTLSKTKISLVKGNSKVIKVEKKKKVTVKKVTWTIKSGAEVVKLTGKSKTQVKVNALKKGTATVVAKIKVGKKTYTRNLKVTVTAPSNPKKTKTPENTPKPIVTDEPDVTNAPNVDSTDTPNVPDITNVPDVTNAPDVTDAPSVSDAPKDTSKPASTPDKVWATNQPDATPVPDTKGGEAAEKSSWNKGVIKSDKFNSGLAGMKVKITLQVRVSGVEEPSGNMAIQSNYNGYPTFATVPLTKEWTPVEIEHRFGEFTNQYPAIYITSDDITDNMTVYYKDVQIEVLEGVDPLGGDPVAPNQWNMVTIANLREGSGATPQKYYENKSIHVSFKLREKGVDDPTGKTVDIQANPGAYVTVKSAVPLTTGWTDVEFDYTFGEITNEWPSIYFSYDGETAAEEGIEFFTKDIVITVTGEAAATPTPAPEESGDNTVTLTGYSDLTSGATTWKFTDGTECPAGFNIANYSSVAVNFKLYDSDDNVITACDDSNGGKLCLNSTSAGDDYNYGYGNGLDLYYLNNAGRYGNSADENGVHTKAFTLAADTTADCITCQLGTGIAKVQIVSIVLTKKAGSGSTETITDATLTGYSALTSGATTWKFADGTGYPGASFNIANYASVEVSFKLYDSDDNVITACDDSNGGKLCLNSTSAGDDYNYGYGNGLDLYYLNNAGRYGSSADENGVHKKSFTLAADTTADCITSQLGTGIAKVEIVSIVLKAK